MPPLAPDIVVEILSPDDRRDDVDDKIGTFCRPARRSSSSSIRPSALLNFTTGMA